ncbi:flagellar basal body-associated FliL family protein [Dongia deserti]|uniref:flagellar basal body-associated FliL family protein n=1 Tax=Dongia deserti TaxID=2268030 RepID=UPI00254823EB|nr:flagellar basal body-associated FliL family protein [Dongia deserti]
MSGKKLVLFIILPLLLFGGGSAAAWLLLFQGHPAGEEVAEEEPAHPPVYYDLEEMTVNLSTVSKRNSYLKLKLALELGSPEDTETLPNVLPRVVDQFQIYLRGVRVEDLQGSDGLQRLREELLLRAQKSAAPAKVRDVLFKVVQIQ